MKKLKPEHKEILTAIVKYLEKNPKIRFGQALFNLNINEFANKENPEKKGYLLRDIYNDIDRKIIERLSKEC